MRNDKPSPISGVLALLSLGLLLVAACTTQPPKPETPRQAIAYGVSAVGSAADAVTIAKANGLLDQSEVQSYKEILNEAMGHLAEAERINLQFEQALAIAKETQTPVPDHYESDIQFRLSQVLAITSIISQMLCEARNECN